MGKAKAEVPNTPHHDHTNGTNELKINTNVPPVSKDNNGNEINDARKILHLDLSQKFLSCLSPRECKFLDSLISNGDASEILKAHDALQDKGLFFYDASPKTETDSSDVATATQKRRDHKIALQRRRDSIEVRRQSSGHIGLWKVHENGISTSIQNTKSQAAPSTTRRSIFPHLALQKTEALQQQSRALRARKVNDGYEVDLIFESPTYRDPREKKRPAAISTTHTFGDELVKDGDTDGEVTDETTADSGFSETLLFQIFGTSTDDKSCTPHVLSPPLMVALQKFLPNNIIESNMWLRFSLVRDGASLYSLLQETRGSKNTLLAIETMDGEVLGSLTTTPWRVTNEFYGSGVSFLWRMRGTRAAVCASAADQAKLESEIDVFKWTGENDMVQTCSRTRLAIGGGHDLVFDSKEWNNGIEPGGESSGFGLALDSDLLYCTSSPCATYANPCLSRNGQIFEVANVEAWTFTHCFTVEDAEKMEMRSLFLSNLGDD